MSDSEWRTDVRPGYRTKTIRVGNCIVTVHRPLLSETERKKVEDQIKISILNLIESVENLKKEKAS